MNLHETTLEGVMLLEAKVFCDERGFFTESYSVRSLNALGIDQVFVQDNHSRSVKGVLRGLHYQVGPPQAKLVQVITGAIFDVAVDIRRGSPTFGEWFGRILSDENHLQMYIPVGFAHGFCVLSDQADVVYKCSAPYAPNGDRGVAWNDPAIGVDWPVRGPILSARDRGHPLLEDSPPDFDYVPRAR